MDNPFLILEIPINSDESTIKSAFRKKAKIFHPDVCKDSDAAEKFKEILKAYELLKNNNWKWDSSSNEYLNFEEVYKDFVKQNPVYSSYFEKKIVKAQARWDSLRNKPY